jgi:hypothetical protein
VKHSLIKKNDENKTVIDVISLTKNYLIVHVSGKKRNENDFIYTENGQGDLSNSYEFADNTQSADNPPTVPKNTSVHHTAGHHTAKLPPIFQDQKQKREYRELLDGADGSGRQSSSLPSLSMHDKGNITDPSHVRVAYREETLKPITNHFTEKGNKPWGNLIKWKLNDYGCFYVYVSTSKTKSKSAPRWQKFYLQQGAAAGSIVVGPTVNELPPDTESPDSAPWRGYNDAVGIANYAIDVYYSDTEVTYDESKYHSKDFLLQRENTATPPCLGAFGLPCRSRTDWLSDGDSSSVTQYDVDRTRWLGAPAP